MKLSDQIHDYVNAAFTGLWIQTHEPDEAEREIVQHARQQQLEGRRLGRGQRPAPAGQPPEPAETRWRRRSAGRPAVTAGHWPTPTARALLLLHNFHRFLDNPEVIQTTFAQLVAGKQQRTFVVVLAPVVQIPVELEKLFVVLEHALPDREQLERIARELTSDEPGDLPKGDDLDARPRRRGRPDPLRGRGRLRPVAGPAQRHPARGDLGAEGPDAQEDQPADAAPGRRAFADLGGLDNLKDFCRRALRLGPAGQAPRRPAAGRAGHAARAHFCKALGNETGRPTLILDIGALMGAPGRPDREQTSARPCGSSTRWRPACASSTSSRRRWPASAAPATAASPPGCSARC